MRVYIATGVLTGNAKRTYQRGENGLRARIHWDQYRFRETHYMSSHWQLFSRRLRRTHYMCILSIAFELYA